ncbi:aspartate-semialdehyde dehydrogenase [Paenibacillus larvae]|uniref:Aspartate-semialdehyde dehydrogenase n=4 Tax=Paenibacillus larvae TaxID=1464 RepID=V9W9V5_9BACL|nr:aspartate-semialdehyde dehydrogenase [Paenibacillus larvae]AHD05902.1 aspartate-semialdehyde dehydrogenase Asd [Paenibacillus larvae subsp. larvae DSM 25430]AQR76651.1 aspartate-semialdehyde dehydrogenase [Paenibacillus larvae subsp. larvae]AQZ48732.1 aspartate-semialdehyde dehydrogenase [Paenibacillus larvae subsp. pulvifaciens]AVF22489.1 aspartate-semialdehyde dehydrogenase Asd [Paenibacillus larvae subsp. larvae]AVF26822.1 aspartate-semialdehyde dehydrogenase Asd [Paenibacillus larvae su
MSNQKLYNVAVVGATGAVGEQIVRLLDERNFPIKELKLLSSARSAGTVIPFKDKEIIVEEATVNSFEGIDFALFSAGGDVSKVLAPAAAAAGAVCIDNTNAFRMDENTPLVVPEVNMHAARNHKGIIANPNCSTIQMVHALKPLYDRYGISRIIASTYQAVSGAGNKATKEMLRQSREVLEGKEVKPDVLPVSSLPVKHQIAFNAIPQIDKFQDNGFTLEEMKMIRETKKIMEDENLQITTTCVRIPVIQGHSESVYVELKDHFEVEEVRQLLSRTPGITVVDNPEEQQYPLASEAAGKKETFVGRIRRDLSNPKALNLWIVSDNLLKGAAWNAVQIAEHLISEDK